MAMLQLGECFCDGICFIFSRLFVFVLSFSVHPNSSSRLLEYIKTPTESSSCFFASLYQASQGTYYCLVFVFLLWTSFPCLQVLERPWREMRNLMKTGRLITREGGLEREKSGVLLVKNIRPDSIPKHI